MTYKELDQHLLETMDHEVTDMRQVSWKDLERLHMLASVLTMLWHPAMKERMSDEIPTNTSYLKDAEVKTHNLYS